MLNWLPGTIVGRREWTPGLFTIRVAVDGVQPFEPGQFLHLANEVNGELVNRAYSVASPHGRDLEFFIVTVSEGKLTPVLEKKKPGEMIQVKERAAGGFTLQKTPDADLLWLIGTGTGLAPYIAMVRSGKIWDRYRKVVVCHGVRMIEDLAYRDELCQLSRERKGEFYYIAASSRASGPGVLTGRLTVLLESGELERACGQEFSRESAVMMCGNPDMLHDMEKLLETRGLTRHRSKSPGQIVVETYW